MVTALAKPPAQGRRAARGRGIARDRRRQRARITTGGHARWRAFVHARGIALPGRPV
jgi:hypothetical protein